MSLEEYRRKRDFSKTREPKGKVKRRKGFLFVVQKHKARSLHYDVRLELDGVLKSWAVPKGPCLDPSQKRLAVQVEDHPVEYGDFEGVVPEGEYGSGPVMLWDSGIWTPEGDVHDALNKGSLKFGLKGEKLKGRWTLIRIRDRNVIEQKNWLLIKERDDEVRAISDFDILESFPNSIETGRSLEGIARDRDRVWGEEPLRRRVAKKKRKKAVVGVSRIPGAKKASIPKRIKPALATLADEPPTGDRWIHEIKFDGYRMMCHLERGQACLISRNGNDWTDRLTPIAESFADLAAKTAVVDGEAVVQAADGTTDFQALQNSLRRGGSQALKFYAFDLLYLDGFDLRGVPLHERKRLLKKLLDNCNGDRIVFSEHIEGDGHHVFEQASNMGLEGVVSKRRDSKYRSGRTPAWLKVKCLQSDDFVIGGYTDSTASRRGFGALIIGERTRDGRLQYAGRVGTGFTDQTLNDLGETLRSLKAAESPFEDKGSPRKKKGTHWVRPTIVVSVEYAGRTDSGVLRHATYRGARDDLAATDLPSQRRRSARQRRATEGASELNIPDVPFTHPDRVFYPRKGITKVGLATYYALVAEWMLPYVANRPLTLVRAPQGQNNKTFYQRHAPAGLPDTVSRVHVDQGGEIETYLAVSDLAGLLALVQFSAIEVHIWGCRKDRLDRPDLLTFDLDPGETVGTRTIVRIACEIRDELTNLRLRSFVKTTGGRGLHVVLPITRRSSWEEVKTWCKGFATQFASRRSNITMSAAKDARKGKIYLDYLRNSMRATFVAPYSTRNDESATVSVPLRWEELATLRRPNQFDIAAVTRRLQAIDEDPWSDLLTIRQSIRKGEFD